MDMASLEVAWALACLALCWCGRWHVLPGVGVGVGMGLGSSWLALDMAWTWLVLRWHGHWHALPCVGVGVGMPCLVLVWALAWAFEALGLLLTWHGHG